MELPVIGFNIAIYHSCDAEVGGPLNGPLNDTSRKRRFYSIKIGSPKKLQTVSALSQSSRLVPLQNKTANPTTSPYSHHVSAGRVEEFTPFCVAASSNGALPTLSCLSERYLYHLVTWDEIKVQADDAHDTGTDTLRWITSSHAYGRRALELFFTILL